MNSRTSGVFFGKAEALDRFHVSIRFENKICPKEYDDQGAQNEGVYLSPRIRSVCPASSPRSSASTATDHSFFRECLL